MPELDRVVATKIALLDAADGRLARPADIFDMVDVEALTTQLINEAGEADADAIARLVARARSKFGGKWRPLSDRARAEAQRSRITAVARVVPGARVDERTWAAAARRHGLKQRGAAEKTQFDRQFSAAARRQGVVLPADGDGGNDAA